MILLFFYWLESIALILDRSNALAACYLPVMVSSDYYKSVICILGTAGQQISLKALVE